MEQRARIAQYEDGTRSFDYTTHHFEKGKLTRRTPYEAILLGDLKFFKDKHGVYNADGTPASPQWSERILSLGQSPTVDAQVAAQAGTNYKPNPMAAPAPEQGQVNPPTQAAAKTK